MEKACGPATDLKDEDEEKKARKETSATCDDCDEREAGCGSESDEDDNLPTRTTDRAKRRRRVIYSGSESD